MSIANLPDSAPKWIVDHVTKYLESGGKEGHMWDSTSVGGPGPLPTLLLTTTGAKSGEPKLSPLIYGEADGAYVLVASKGGAPKHPAWYINLRANPEVQLQVGPEVFSARARTAAGAERQTLWDQMVGVYPPYTDYQEKTSREIPVVVLERA